MTGSEHSDEHSGKKPFLKRPVSWVLLSLVLYALVGFIVVPIVAKNLATDFVQETFNRKLEIGSLSLNPFTFTATVGAVALYETTGDSFLTADEVFVNLSILPLLDRAIDLPEVRASNPFIAFRMNADSTFNIDDFVAYVMNMPESEPWAVSVDSLVVTGLRVSVIDRTTTPEAQLGTHGGEIRVGGFRKDSPDTAGFLVRSGFLHGGKAEATGLVVPLNRFVRTKFLAEGISLVPVQPYLARYAYLTLNSGRIGASGDIDLLAENPEQPEVSFVGDFNVDTLDLYDNLQSERFLAWQRLSVDNLEAGLNPLRVRTDEIRVDEIYLRLEIAADQSLNAKDVLAPTLTGADSTATDTLQLPDIYIGRIVLAGGEADFADFSLPLPFATKIHSLTGEITEIVPNNPTGAAITARGAIDEYGLAKADGGLDPFSPLAYTDINVVLTNIELTRLTPYSGKFAGYEIEKGKMSVDLEYVIRNGQLVGKNEMLLEKLTLGEEIESPDATSLPVKLAIALLKDGDGNIDLDLEVEGDLYDPEVNMASLVWQALTKVIVNIVSAPFRFLGSLLGISGDEMEYIQFEPGKTDLTPPQHERLGNLAKALGERPALRLDVHGTFDGVTDARALRDARFDSLLQQKMSALGMSPAGEDSATQASKLLRRALEELYVEEFDQYKLAELQGLNATAATDSTAPTLDVRAYLKAVRSALVEQQPLDEEELPSLADQRAVAIRNHMVTVHLMPEERVLIDERENIDDEDDEWVRCRLELEAMDDVADSLASPAAGQGTGSR
jgi:hypothetical protein